MLELAMAILALCIAVGCGLWTIVYILQMKALKEHCTRIYGDYDKN